MARLKRCTCGKLYEAPQTAGVVRSIRALRNESPSRCKECLSHMEGHVEEGTLGIRTTGDEETTTLRLILERIYASTHWHRLRTAIYRRDHGTCHYCARHVHHRDYVAAHTYATATLLKQLGLAACLDPRYVVTAHRRCAESNPPPAYDGPSTTQTTSRPSAAGADAGRLRVLKGGEGL